MYKPTNSVYIIFVSISFDICPPGRKPPELIDTKIGLLPPSSSKLSQPWTDHRFIMWVAYLRCVDLVGCRYYRTYRFHRPSVLRAICSTNGSNMLAKLQRFAIFRAMAVLVSNSRLYGNIKQVFMHIILLSLFLITCLFFYHIMFFKVCTVDINLK